MKVRSTKSFYERSTYTPPRYEQSAIKTKSGGGTAVQGGKKCFVISSRGQYKVIGMLELTSRLNIQPRISFDMYFFECTDFTMMTRNCQNSVCFITTPSSKEPKLGCIVYLPQCASVVYYLEWNGHCDKDLPDFVRFNSSTPSNSILDSFTFKKAPISSQTTITFVQLVLGPFTDFTFVCNYNHFDYCLEVLPDGPSNMFPNNMWFSSIIKNLVATSRNESKAKLTPTIQSDNELRLSYLQSLPSVSDIFQVIKKRSHNDHPYLFSNGKTVRKNLQVMHVKIEVPTETRLTQCMKNEFLIPFLGPLLGQFGNVDIDTLENLNEIFQNGISISRHNRLLKSVSRSVVSYTVCDNNSNPIVITFVDKPSVKINLSHNKFGGVVDWCLTSSHIIQSFVFYSQYCHPILIDSSHKAFLRKAVQCGSGNRSCSKVPSGITNFYFGSRSNPTLAQASPVVGPKMCSHHDNYRSSWSAPMLASFVQTSNSLTQCIQHVSRWTNPILERACCLGSHNIGKTVENWQLCRTTILTFSDSRKYLGFVNTAHIDKKDRYKNSIQKDIHVYSDSLRDIEGRKYLLNNLRVGVG